MIVADANLLFNLTVRQAGTAAAYGVHVRDPDWWEPALWESEFRHAVTTQLRARRMTLEQGLAAYDRALEVIAGRTEAVDGRGVLKLAASSGASAYDCEYVWLAHALHVRLVSFDRKLQQMFPGVAVSPEEFTAG